MPKSHKTPIARGFATLVPASEGRRKQQAAGAAIALLLMMFSNTGARADVSIGTITATFTDPVLIGNLLNYPSPGENTLQDDTGTAVYSGTGTSTLDWGANGGDSTTSGDYSYLMFIGASGLADSASSPTTIGTITYYNGTSSNGTEIFGATLNFYLNGTYLGSDAVVINSTVNQNSGTSLSPAQLQADADYINICGNSSNICGTSIESYESTEVIGYAPLVVNLQAVYNDAPGITITGTTINSGNGALGNFLPLAAVPEPASLMLLGSGLLAFAGVRARRRQGK